MFEITDEQILALNCVSLDSDEHGTSFWVDQRTVLAIARAILALRPVQVPMTDDERKLAAIDWSPCVRAAFNAGVKAAERHHGIKPKEQA